jgi:hypothetical protein
MVDIIYVPNIKKSLTAFVSLSGIPRLEDQFNLHYYILLII